MKDSKIKEFIVSSWSLTNRTTVMVVTAIILFAGIGSYTSMPKEAFPEIIIPTIYVGTAYPGNSPEDIEKLITRPIEKEINTISDVDVISSTSVQGYSSIQVEFDFSISPEEALRKVKDKVDVAMGDPDFPSDLPADPNVFELNISELTPIMNINLSGDFPLDQLKDYGEYLKERIEEIPQISEVEIRGVMDKEVRVDVDFLKMEARKVSFGDIAQAIQQENVTISGGDILVDRYKRSVRVIGEFEHYTDLLDIIVKQERGVIVYLRDVATVYFGEEDKESYARQNTKPVVMVDVMKRAGENLLIASDTINNLIEDARANYFPSNLEVKITGDQSDQTRTQVSELENSIIFGMILVVGVLLYFLGLRNALFVGVAIPMSMFLSFLILSALGVTLNTMVLFSLVLALGMLVDNGIVVVENIYRLRDEGYSAIEASKLGVGEVAWPIIASTATTLAAFVPLAIWPGLIGKFMYYLPLTLMIVLGSSLFVAIVINPVLTSLFMKLKEEYAPLGSKQFAFVFAALLLALVMDLGGDQIPALDTLAAVSVSAVLLFLLGKFAFMSSQTPKKAVLFPSLGLVGVSLLYMVLGQTVSANFIGITGTFLILNAYILFPSSVYFQNKLLPWLENAYDKFIRSALKKRRPQWLLAGTFMMLLFSFGLIGAFAPKVLFFPENEPQYLNIFIELPIGTDIEETNKLTKKVERLVLDELDKPAYKSDGELVLFKGEEVKTSAIVESVIGQVGAGTSDPVEGPSTGNTPHKARIQVSFVKYQERFGIFTTDVQSAIREAIGSIPDVKVTVAKNSAGPPQGAPVNIEMRGDDYDQLMAEAKAVKSFINNSGVPGIEELKLDVKTGKPELPIYIERAKARRLGVSTAQIGDALRTSLFGKEVSTYKEGEDDYPINIRFKQDYRNDLDALLNQRITFRDMASGQIVQVPISSVATAEKTSTFSAVKRKDLTRVITITSNVLADYNPTEVVNGIKGTLVDYELPKDIELQFTGQQEEQAEEMAFLSGALLIALFLIILIIVLQFNSISAPVIIGTSVIFSMIGVFIGLVVFQMDFVIIMTMIGIISLAGIVVNNAIVLMDYTKLLMDRKKEELGMTEEQWLSKELIYLMVVEGGKTRLRPVLLTAITTILGLLPLAVGLNIDFFGLFTELDPKIYVGGDNVMFWGPMSWTIIFGLTFATFLTLVIVPSMFYMFTIFKRYTQVRKNPELAVD